MKKLVSLLLTIAVFMTMLTACGSSDENKALKVIEKFISATEKGDNNTCIKCMDPDIQTIAESGTNSIGKALGIENAYGMSNAFASLFSTAFSDETDTNISIKQKEIKSKKVEKESAVFCIEYDIKISSKMLESPVEGSGILEFKMTKKSGKWYILSVSAVSDDADTEIVANGMNIVSGTSFSDGVALIQCKDSNDKYFFAAINTKGEKLFEFEDEAIFSSKFSNGILVAENSIYNKKGQVIASPEKTGYDRIADIYEMPKNIDGFVIVTKTEESFSGDKYLYGVINKKGEWEVKLSEKGEFSISNYEFSWDQEERGILEDRLIVSKTGYESRAYDGETPGIYKYNTNGGNGTIDTKATFELLVPNILNALSDDNLLDDVFVGYSFGDSDRKINLYDYNGKVVMNLSQYKIGNLFSNHGKGIYYKKGHLLIKIDNNTGSEYLCLFNKDGKPAFEPIKLEGNDDYFLLDETGFVLEVWDQSKGNNTYKHYDYSGKITDYDGVCEFGGFNDGLALVKNTAGQYYYINVNGEKVIK